MDTRQKIPIGIMGCAIHTPADAETCSLEESLYQVVQAALKDAGLKMTDIDGIVVAGNDQMDGRAISIMAASGSVGGVGRDIMSTPSASEHAFVLGALRVASGQYRTQLVVSWSPLEVDSVSSAQHLATDPYFHRALPQDDLSAYAMQAISMESRFGRLREQASAVARHNQRHGAVAYPKQASNTAKAAGSGTPRWPLSGEMLAPPAFGAVAMIMACDSFIQERDIQDVAWLHGVGWATETGFLGDRDLARLESLETAASVAYQQAGISNPALEIDVLEVSDPTPYQQMLACVSLGLCAGDDLKDYFSTGTPEADKAPTINPSGGALTYNPLFCTGLMRIAEAAEQVRQRCGAHQKAHVQRSLAHAASGFAMQYNTVAVFGRDRREMQ